MKKITLIHHPKVKMNNKTKIDATALPQWIYDYDNLASKDDNIVNYWS